MMNIQELDTCARYNIPVKVFILNNSCLGMVRQWQQLFYEHRYSNTIYSRNPDFVKIAEGMGVCGFSATRPEEIRKTIEAALKVQDRPWSISDPAGGTRASHGTSGRLDR